MRALLKSVVGGILVDFIRTGSSSAVSRPRKIYYRIREQTARCRLIDLDMGFNILFFLHIAVLLSLDNLTTVMDIHTFRGSFHTLSTEVIVITIRIRFRVLERINTRCLIIIYRQQEFT